MGDSRAVPIEVEAFDAFPYGLLVFNEERELVRQNAAARVVLQGEEGTGRPPTCCELLGCGVPSTPLASGCLTRAAAEHGSALPEVRIDLPRGGLLAGAWVMAAPLRADGSRVAVQVRPGEAHDRRRGSVPEAAGRAELRMYTFGRTRIESRDGPVGGKWLAGRAGDILKFLLCERHRIVSTDEIIDNVWPGPELRTAGNVRFFVHTLRKNLEPSRAPGSRASVLLSQRGGYGLDRSRVWVDADVFEDRARTGLLAFRRGAIETAVSALEEAMAHYHGDFLADVPYADWVLGERDRLRGVSSDALRALAKIRLDEADREGAFVHAERLAELQPFDVDVRRQVLALMLARGRRSDAVRHYAAFRDRMVREFGEEPGFVLADVSREDEQLA